MRHVIYIPMYNIIFIKKQALYSCISVYDWHCIKKKKLDPN